MIPRSGRTGHIPLLRRATTVAATLLVSAASALAFAPAASADTHVCTTRYDGRFCSGEVAFEALGEHLIIKDIHKDGHGVKGYLQQYYDFKWHWVSPSSGRYHGKGAGTEVDVNYSVPDGRYVRIKACLSEAGGPGFACSGWQEDRA
ncbi:hypothetical protein B0I33_11145 [Prauserella shujinwangii]|uniref:Peptidase inhibitor family I36 n=1 Tax=Prauserella shujinwangii TaxID=1453103 RepID=A0A2T0LMW7_9PSEU|nr:hypothetical protein [Prauserella shujinwangii]PRX44537.1 hypothetical protein B0I33_11145 [Prauserella shujinwangii]